MTLLRVPPSTGWLLFLPAAALCVAACADDLPTSDDGGEIPLEVETVEVRLPFSEFATDTQS